MSNKKIAIVVGHNSRAQGAVRVTDGVSEFEWNSDLAKMIREHNPEAVKIFNRTPGGGYSAEIDRVYRETDNWGADCTVELHFNSVESEHATGTLTLTSGTSGSLKLAHAVNDQMVMALGLKDRGLQVRGRRDRGGRSLWQGRAPAIMVEPYFGSNRSDCAAADLHKDKLAEAIYRGACEAIGMPVKPADTKIVSSPPKTGRPKVDLAATFTHRPNRPGDKEILENIAAAQARAAADINEAASLLRDLADSYVSRAS